MTPVRRIALIFTLAWAGLAGLAAVALTVVSVVWLVDVTSDSLSMTTNERDSAPARADSLKFEDFRFLAKRIPGTSTYFLHLSDRTRRDPFTAGGSRNFALFFLYPAVAVDDRGDADYVVGLDGARLQDAGVPTVAIERRGQVSVAPLR